MAGGTCDEGGHPRLQAGRAGPGRRRRHDRGRRVPTDLEARRRRGDAPDATDEDRTWRQILIAAAIQGAIFAVVKARSTARAPWLPGVSRALGRAERSDAEERRPMVQNPCPFSFRAFHLSRKGVLGDQRPISPPDHVHPHSRPCSHSQRTPRPAGRRSRPPGHRDDDRARAAPVSPGVLFRGARKDMTKSVAGLAVRGRMRAVIGAISHDSEYREPSPPWPDGETARPIGRMSV